MPELVYEVGGNICALFFLHEGKDRKYRIGRDSENDFCLSQADPTTSGRHGLIRFRNGGFAYEDGESRNGSFLQRVGADGEAIWEPIKDREVQLSPGDVIRLGEMTLLHFGDYLAHGSFFLAERLVEMFVASEKEAGDFQELASTFLYRLLGIVLNIMQAREGFIQLKAPLAGTTEDLRESGFRAREIPHVRRGERATLRTLLPSELQTMDWQRGEIEPLSSTWIRMVQRGDTIQHLFGEEIGIEFTRVQPPETAKAMRHKAICVPLRATGQRLGVIYIAREQEMRTPFTSEDVQRAEDLGFLAGAVLLRLLGRKEADPLDEMVGNLEARQEILAWERNPDVGAVPVLVSGERGTGKEIIARAIHYHSMRRTGPFIPVNAAVHGGERLAPELFGTAAGKFTNVIDSPGLFEVASGGTLFLDEISEMNQQAQSQLLRAVEQKEITRVGGTKTIPVDVRVVSATNRDLGSGSPEGRFRADLLDRLSFLRVKLMPVREFPEDQRHELFIKVLARVSSRFNIWALNGIDQEALAILMRYPWLGNAREVEKELGNAAIRWASESPKGHSREIGTRHLTPEVRLYNAKLMVETKPPSKSAASRRDAGAPESGETAAVDPNLDLHRAIEAVNRDYFQRALEIGGGRAEEAAKLLGLNIKTFYRRARELGLGGRDIRRKLKQT